MLPQRPLISSVGGALIEEKLPNPQPLSIPFIQNQLWHQSSGETILGHIFGNDIT